MNPMEDPKFLRLMIAVLMDRLKEDEFEITQEEIDRAYRKCILSNIGATVRFKLISDYKQVPNGVPVILDNTPRKS